jgi:hypothetical protein
MSLSVALLLGLQLILAEVFAVELRVFVRAWEERQLD